MLEKLYESYSVNHELICSLILHSKETQVTHPGTMYRGSIRTVAAGVFTPVNIFQQVHCTRPEGGLTFEGIFLIKKMAKKPMKFWHSLHMLRIDAFSSFLLKECIISPYDETTLHPSFLAPGLAPVIHQPPKSSL